MGTILVRLYGQHRLSIRSEVPMISSLAEIRKPFREASLRHLPALDKDIRTLHIRCGKDIEKKLAIAGFVGDFLCFSDPSIQTVISNVDFNQATIDIHNKNIRESFGVSVDEFKSSLQKPCEDLQKSKDYHRVVMWFEYDSYHQLVLARLLSFFSDPANRPKQLQLICVPKLPGIRQFVGLSQLTPEILHNLWDERKELTAVQFQQGIQAWQAIKSDTPAEVIRLVSTGMKEMPNMSKALQRLLQELPSSCNGLSMSEELTLKILRDKGELYAERLFHFYIESYESMPFMGDVNYWSLLQGLADAEQPAIDLVKDGDGPHAWRVRLTATGLVLLHNQLDWLNLNHIVRRVGGILIDSREKINWRFDRSTGSIMAIPAR